MSKLFCYIGIHSWKFWPVESALPETNYYSNSRDGSGYTTTDFEMRKGRKCERCSKEQVLFWPNRLAPIKYIKPLNKKPSD